MKRLRFLKAARADLEQIYLHVREETGDDRLAEVVADRLVEQCEHLAGLSGTMGRPRPELHPDIRSFPYRGYVIFFRYEGGELVVVNVLSGRRDIDGLFEAAGD